MKLKYLISIAIISTLLGGCVAHGHRYLHGYHAKQPRYQYRYQQPYYNRYGRNYNYEQCDNY